MDLNQRKLIKSEWESIEIPVSRDEIEVLLLIIKGYQDVNIKINKNDSIFTFLKIEYSVKMEDYLYNKYLREIIQMTIITHNLTNIKIEVTNNIQIKSADKIRLEKNTIENLKKLNLYEYVLLNYVNNLLENKVNSPTFILSYFTLYKLLKNNIQKINRHVLKFCKTILDIYKDDINLMGFLENSVELIEKNVELLKYDDMILYDHQKEIFTICKNPQPKLILYMAPTGTGKTLTPLGLSEKYRVIFVCAARHVGLALARSAISVNKKIAFAFGCASADDIRLHYFAAKDYTVNKRSGSIKKVDNSNGENVEIIISDIKSFIPAMYYMKAFNTDEQIIVYWDEPTITLDYKEHSFHEIIKKNWSENSIPTVILSSATLPKIHELSETVLDFKNKFTNSEVFQIVSHDCKKSIPIINKNGFIELPHYLDICHDYENVLKIVKHCENYLTLLRYFDLKEVIQFIIHINKNNLVGERFKIESYFDSLDDVNMKNIKLYYIQLLKNLDSTKWSEIYKNLIFNRSPKLVENITVDSKGKKISSSSNSNSNILSKMKSIGPGVNLSNITSAKPFVRSLTADNDITSNTNTNQSGKGSSGIFISTKDAYTLTDGPTIFICDDIEKISKFCIQQANIPTIVMDELMKKIEYNNILNGKIDELEKELDYLKEQEENKLSASSNTLKNVRKFNRDSDNVEESKTKKSKLTKDVENFRQMIKNVSLNDTFIPNKLHHLKKWADGLDCKSVFTCDIKENIINDILLLNGIDDTWKILLLMGIGVFITHENIKYTEIMKKLADEQKLFTIIASSDYIYGTNYQFCHGYISKGMNLTQEKIIQAMGRVGRNNIQQNYSLRFRDDDQIIKILTNEPNKPEIINMNLLFNSDSSSK
jgi:tetrahydromethanopterin S-methyltransferase subunit G